VLASIALALALTIAAEGLAYLAFLRWRSWRSILSRLMLANITSYPAALAVQRLALQAWPVQPTWLHYSLYAWGAAEVAAIACELPFFTWRCTWSRARGAVAVLFANAASAALGPLLVWLGVW
jgi:hypothetical protein